MSLWKRLFGKQELIVDQADDEQTSQTEGPGPAPSGPATLPAAGAASHRTGTDRRDIRVFISSTFRDMMRERDLLVKEVFPELRRKCASRFVTFTEVDLRWGITEEQAAEGQVLPLCLAEIERSRPYFIGRAALCLCWTD